VLDNSSVVNISVRLSVVSPRGAFLFVFITLEDRHGAVLKGFAALCHYAELRQRSALGAYHHLRLSRLCVPLYLRCLSILGGPPGPPEAPGGPQGPSIDDVESPSLRQEWLQLRMVS
ncbi:hypothetical protein EAH_00065530, partial [Eimeria acervulina]